ncbi:PREDICTED: putative leucine-rich repeat-containing protein DDB_G0290503 isoform X7 [Amphimedon queenslandica]|uniref:Uncharacterized protein n=1 Tax=Amphimedon queenslandica TaxID=400682 RepID=A0AAN0IXT1_AMPQE|nr:PREDICTED: putative leucine-rich repeat-containing protein DDB_G0290503 isoform X7 [Amphimedon queenslandica]|eukprot:XP_019849251.1 PREDICTED: putative leucine-rich repeat-containing protein DDB_G0290503 isoform X7 [Amphimedon queenslandica]
MSSSLDISSSSTGGGSSSSVDSSPDQKKSTSSKKWEEREEEEEEEEEDQDDDDDDAATDDEEDDEEDNVILELREVYKQSVTTTMQFEDSSDSLDADDSEKIRAKLRVLRDYVNDLQSSYDELLDTFGELETAAKEKIKTLEDKLAKAVNSPMMFSKDSSTTGLEREEYSVQSLPPQMINKDSSTTGLEEQEPSLQHVQMISKDSSTTGLKREESSVPQVHVQVDARVPMMNKDSSTTDLEREESSLQSLPQAPMMNKDSSTTDLETKQSLLSAEILMHEAKIQQLTDENQEPRSQRDKLDSVAPSDTQREPAGNEEQMKRFLSLINSTRRQLSSLSTSPTVNEVSDWNTDQPNNVDQVALKLEEDVSSLREKWSELNAQLEESQGTIAELTGRELVLTSQLDQSSARVVVLESLLQAQSTSLMGQEELLTKDNSYQEMSDLQEKPKSLMTSSTEESREQINVHVPVFERDCHIAELETRVQELEYQLQESEHNRELLLNESQSNIRKYYWNKASNRDDDASDSTSQSEELREERDELINEVEREREKVRELEKAQEIALQEMELLQSKIRSLPQIDMMSKDSSTTGLERDSSLQSLPQDSSMRTTTDLETEQFSFPQHVHVHMMNKDSSTTDLEMKQSLLSQAHVHMMNKGSSTTGLERKRSPLQSIPQAPMMNKGSSTTGLEREESSVPQVHVQVDARVPMMNKDSSTTDLETKQSLLSAEILMHEAKIQQLTDENQEPMTQRDELDPAMTTKRAVPDTTRADSAGKEGPVALKLEEDVSSLREKWSELNAQLEESQGTIAELTGRELVLTSQLDQSSARVVVLESLLQVQSTSLMGQEELLTKNKSALNILREEIEDTKNSYEISCQEMRELQEKLKSAMMCSVEELESLRQQIKERDARIKQVEDEATDLWSLHNQTSLVLKEGERVQEERLNQLEAVEEELREAREVIDHLESELEKDCESRLNELDEERALLIDIINQLVGGNIEETMSNPTDIQARLAQRDQLLSTLQEETARLLETHSHASHEVKERQRIINDLETSLALSQDLCNTLDKKVNGNRVKLDAVQRELAESEREKEILAEQVIKLQLEAEDICSALEKALIKSNKLTVDNQLSVTSLQDQLMVERSTSRSLRSRLSEALGGVDSLTDNLRETVVRLETENERLRLEKGHIEEAMSNLHEQLDEDSSKYQSMHQELTEALALMEELKRQESRARADRNESEVLAEKRLEELSLSQEKCHTLHCINGQLEEEIRAMKEKQDSLQQSVQDTSNSLRSLYDSKCLEYDQLLSEHSVLIEKDTVISAQLEECHKELKLCKKRASELDSRYKDSLKELERTQTELDVLRTSGKAQQNSDRKATQKRLQMLNEKVSLLEIQLNTTTERLEETEQALVSVEQEKRKLLHKLSTLEEHYSSLVRSHSQQKLELSHSQRKLDRQHKQFSSLQKDYDTVVGQISDWADTQRSSSEGLINKIKEQDDEISSLKAQKREAQAETETLKSQFQQKEQTSPNAPSTNGHSVPNSLRKLDLQYQATLEKGMSGASASVMDTSGYSSPTVDSSDEMDKQYWIRRSAELSIQLQESSEYWTNRVRELTLTKLKSTSS